MKKIKNFISYSSFLFFLLILPSSCQNYSTSDFNPEDSVCSNFEQHEFTKDFIYEHIKYNLKNSSPFDLIPEENRALFIQEYNSLKILTDNMDFNEALDYFEGEGQIAANIASDLRVAYDYIETEIENPDSNPDQVINGLQILIDQKKTDDSMFCPERKAVIAVYSALQGLFEYIKTDANLYSYDYSSSNSQISTRGGGWGCLIPCLVSNVSIGGLWGTIAGVAITVATGGTGIPLVVAWTITGMSVGVVAGLDQFNAGNESNCHSCGDYYCNSPTAVSLAFSSCNPSATYTASGFGSDVTTLTWTNTGGTPATATTPVNAISTAILNITQITPSTPVITTITTDCPNSDQAETNVFSRNLSVLSTQVIGLTLHGEDHAVPGEIYRYHVFGAYSNPVYTIEWFINNGTIVNSGDSFADVIWDAGDSWIQAQVTNTCPGGASRTYTFYVTGDGGEIP